MRFVRQLRHFTSCRDVLLCGRMIGLWGILPLLLHLPLERLLRLLTPKSLPVRDAAAQAMLRQKLRVFAGYWFSRKYVAAHTTCLKRSLVFYYLLRHIGVPARFCLGVKKERDTIIGHSWLEAVTYDRQSPSQSGDFVTIYIYPV